MEYKPLIAEEGEIRLITIHPAAAESDDIIHCSLDHYALTDLYHTQAYKQHLSSCKDPDDDGEASIRASWIEYSRQQRSQEPGDGWVDVAPLVDDATKNLPIPRFTWGDYLALSYTWGENHVTRPINVNGQVIPVTENLEQGLRVLRDKQYIEDGWKLWIDAICINQQDIIERATQVKRMREIYSKAWTPIIWLGLGGDESDAAIDLIKLLATTYTMRDQVNALTSVLSQDPKAFGEGRWRALYQFTVRRYWRRAWILQEASLGGDDMPILCGKKTISWIDVHRAFWLLNKTDEVINKYITNEVEEAGLTFDVAIWNSLFVVGEIHKNQSAMIDNDPVNLYRVMSLSRNVFATDPRDKIYGLLAMMEESVTRKIVPDYTAAIDKVYVDFAKSTIDVTNSLEILRHTSTYGTQDLPSWVPDWTAEHRTSSLTLSNKLHATSGTSRADIRYLDNRKISVKGFKIDTFDGMGCLWARQWSPDSVEQFKSPDTNPNPYGSPDAVREAIWRTMVADRDIYVEPLTEDYSSLLATPAILNASESQLAETDPLLTELAQSNILKWGAGFLRGNSDFIVCGEPVSAYLPSTLDRSRIDATILRDALVARDRINVRRRMVTTGRGYVGMALEEVRRDDVICVLLGCSMPMVLRPVSSTEAVEARHESVYKVVGECYIHGIMGGEAMEWLDSGECQLEELIIC